ncbi:hypothetical protein M2317_000821 [Microbacterium sp. ZKA21]|uniref:hypothetical protein n=1 Tax=Microbacterium sp. ZKA21 TaxID=3381694 RepID=UPI003D1E1FF1
MSTHDERLRAALVVRELDGRTEQVVTMVEDVDGRPLHIDEIYQQTVVFVPEAFGVAAEEVEAAALIESAEIEEEA